MRTIFLGLVVATSGLAQTAADACNRLMSSDERVRCVGLIAGRTFESAPLASCNRLMSGEQILACVEAAADRHYEASALSVCDSLMDGDGIVRCVAAAGAPLRRRDDREDRGSWRRRRSRDDEEDEGTFW